MLTTHEILITARALYAASPAHTPSDEMPEPGTYCPLTAIDQVTSFHPSWSDAKAVNALRDCIDAESIVQFNQDHSTEEVLAAFDRAIEATA
jgi:hypothetical protein